jgi:hypothetical protein
MLAPSIVIVPLATIFPPSGRTISLGKGIQALSRNIPPAIPK